jgi:hypothetical protein
MSCRSSNALNYCSLPNIPTYSAWIPNTDLTPLSVEDVTNFSEKGKAKNLVAAYHVAAEEHDLQYFKDMLAEHMQAMIEDQEAREAKAAEKAAKADKKKKRKSTEAVDDEDVDMDDAENEGGGPKKGSKKRKKEADSDGETEKVCPTTSLSF